MQYHSIFLRKIRQNYLKARIKGKFLKQLNNRESLLEQEMGQIQGGTRTATTSVMELFVVKINSFYQKNIVTKTSVLDVETVLSSSGGPGLDDKAFELSTSTFFKVYSNHPYLLMIFYFYSLLFIYSSNIAIIMFSVVRSHYIYLLFFFIINKYF